MKFLNKMKIIIFILLIFFGINNISAISTTPNQQREALIETAEAYYRQGSQLQYDSYRKNLYSTPEDATDDHITYTVCSGFVFSVYYQTLGINIPDTTEELLDYAKQNVKNKENIIFYYGSSNEIYSKNVLGSASNADKQKFIESIINVVKPGDIFVYTGHAMLVKSVNIGTKTIQLMDSWGKRYDYLHHSDIYDQNGTIKIVDMKERLNKTSTEMALIRIVTDGQTYINNKNQLSTYDGVTASAHSRLKYNKIDIEKTIDIKDGLKQNALVALGEFITYDITIKNNSNTYYKNLVISEIIDSKVKIKSLGGASLKNNELKWTVSSLKPGGVLKLSYSVQVPNDKNLLGKFIVSTGQVDNIAITKIETLIGNKLNSEQQKKINNSFKKIQNNSSVERNFINDIYLSAFGVDLKLENLSNLDIIGYNSNVISSGNKSLSVIRTELKNSPVKKYIYSNLYGLRIFGGVDKNINSFRDCPVNNLVRAIGQWNYYPKYEINDRARTITPDMLIDGDIILLYTNDKELVENKNKCPVENLENRSYIYLNNTLLRKISSNKYQEISGNELTQFLRNIIGENYIVLRPSLALELNSSKTNTTNTIIDNSNDNKVTESVDIIDSDVTTDVTESIDVIDSKIIDDVLLEKDISDDNNILSNPTKDVKVRKNFNLNIVAIISVICSIIYAFFKNNDFYLKKG